MSQQPDQPGSKLPAASTSGWASSPVAALAMILCVNTVNFYDRQVLGVLTEPIRKEWQLDDFAIGILGTAFILVYAVAGLPLGKLCDRAPRRFVLAAGVFLWSLFTGATFFVQTYWQLFVLRLGVGIGEAACAPAVSSWIGDLFPAQRRGRAVSVYMLGLPVGIALSYLVSSRVAAIPEYGWRGAFLVAGMPGLLCAVLALLLREPARGAMDSPRAVEPAAAGGASYLSLLKNSTMLWIIASGVFINFVMYTVGAFLSAYLMRYHQLPLKEAADLSLFVYGLSGVPGLFVAGLVADRLVGRSAGGRLTIAAICALLAAPVAAWSLLQGPEASVAFCCLMGSACMLLYAYYPTVYPAIQDVVPPALRGRAMALYFCGMYLCGGALGPLATGALSDYFAGAAASARGVVVATASDLTPYRAEGLQRALWLVPWFCLALALVLFGGARSARKRARHAAMVSTENRS